MEWYKTSIPKKYWYVVSIHEQKRSLEVYDVLKWGFSIDSV